MKYLVGLTLLIATSACGPTQDPKEVYQADKSSVVASLSEVFSCKVQFKQSWTDGDLFDLDAKSFFIKMETEPSNVNVFDGDSLQMSSKDFISTEKTELGESPSVNYFQVSVFPSDEESELCSESSQPMNFTTSVVFTHLERSVHTTSEFCMDKAKPEIATRQIVSLGPQRAEVGTKTTQQTDPQILHGDTNFSGVTFELQCIGQ